MSQEQAAEFIKQAGDAIGSGQFSEALDALDKALGFTPDSADAHGMRGIALSQLQRPEEATSAFRRAISISPNNPKVYFNLAVHLYGQDQKVEAMEMAKEATRLDFSHTGAKDLIARIESDMNGPSVDGVRPMGAPPAAEVGSAPTVAYPRPGYDEEAVHSVALVEKLGTKWVPLGWLLIVVAMVVFGVIWSQTLPMITSMIGNPNAAEEMQKMQAQMPSYMQIIGILGWLNRALILTWMIMDILDRRASFFWLITVVPCCSCGLEWVGPIAYILFGRKTA